MVKRNLKGLRPLIFWSHLIVACSAGLFIFLMAITGCLIAFEQEIISLAEDRQLPPLQQWQSQMQVDEVLKLAAKWSDPGKLTRLTIHRDESKPHILRYGKEVIHFVDPTTGKLLEKQPTALRGFFSFVEGIHRWLSFTGEKSDAGGQVTGAACLSFLFLVFSGIVLWWPRRWNWKTLKAITVPSMHYKGRSWYWNWHNAFGFWLALPLLVTTTTGVIMSYTWAGDLLYTLGGSEPPPRREKGGNPKLGKTTGDKKNQKPETMDSMNGMIAVAQERVPTWNAISIIWPREGQPTINLMVEDARMLTVPVMIGFDKITGLEKKEKPAAGYGRTLRSWVRPLHTGTFAGWFGKTLVTLIAMGAMLLVWTGTVLSWRRLIRRENVASTLGQT